MSAEAYLDSVLSIWAERHQRTTSRVSGDSMAPLLRHGDLLHIEHGNESIRIGDILVFKGPGRLLVHRLICRKRIGGKELLMAKGDHCSTYDSPITSDEIVGKVIAVTGSRRHIRLDSRGWTVANFLLAGVSRVSARNTPLGSTVWRAARLVRSLRLTVRGERSAGAVVPPRDETPPASDETVGWRCR